MSPSPATGPAPVVLYVGIEWDQLPDSFAPEVKQRIKAGIAQAMAELRALGVEARWCGVPTAPAAAVALVRAAVATTPVDCVLIGAGLRKTDQVLVLFEQIVNAVRVACPGAALCFNTVPEDSAEAVRRWLARP
ncbi:MAG: hypothetical protein IPH44_39075 [Myxococcales bacterium]|nr:hypothetical protein [Myxococcales bacterium]MBK7198962.1 hypothetical protein [Myxococcales bacterium]MBP6847610.1 hypothetical protein [Kofleriaceae bacterium]